RGSTPTTGGLPMPSGCTTPTGPRSSHSSITWPTTTESKAVSDHTRHEQSMRNDAAEVNQKRHQKMGTPTVNAAWQACAYLLRSKSWKVRQRYTKEAFDYVYEHYERNPWAPAKEA